MRNKFIPYILIILVAFLVRFFYWQYALGVIVSEDTYSYYQAGQMMLREFFFVNHYRAPVYSSFLAFLVNVLGAKNAPILSGPFTERVIYAIPIQMAVGILGLVILYNALRQLKISVLFSLIFILFIGTNIIIFSWERLLLTESFAVFFLILLFFLTVRILQKPRFIFFLLLLLLAVCSVMLRPFNIGLPFIPLLVAVMYHRKKTVFISAVAVVLLYIGFIHIYSSFNLKRWGYYGISRASDINMLGKILEYRLPVSAGKNEKYIYDLVVDYQSQQRDPHPFRFLEYYSLLDDDDIPKLIPLKKFSYQVIGANLSTYLKKSAILLPGAMMDVSEKLIILPPNQSLTSRIFNLNLGISRYSQVLFFLIFVFVWVSLIQFLKMPTYINAALTLSAGISLYQIIFSVFIGHGEYGRLIVPAQPIMYFFSIFWLIKILEWGKKWK